VVGSARTTRAARRDQIGIALTVVVVVDAVKRSAARVVVFVENMLMTEKGGKC
jgi:hypothetical protein